MFHKKCDTCKNQTCLKTNRICKSLNNWLKDNIESKMGWREKLGYVRDVTETLTMYEDTEIWS